MAVGTALVIVIALVAVIWIFIEVKRFRHKIFAVFLIILILFTYISFSITLKGKDLDLTSVDGVKMAGSLYLSWLGSVFKNLKSLTTNAIHMDWKPNKTIDDFEES